MGIHRTAVVEGEVGSDVEIGPFAVIAKGAVLGDRVRVGAHAVIEAGTTVGAGTVIHAHAVLGGSPQDLKHDEAVPTRLVLGEDNVVREFVTLHRGSSGGRGETRIGARNYFMANSHVAHDCVVGDDTMFANSASIAGHCHVSDGAVIGGLAGVHQFARVGRYAMVAAGAMCAQDVPPFTLAQGDRARLYGLNVVGLKRRGFSADTVHALKAAWRTLFVSGLAMRAAVARVREEEGSVPEVAELLDFVAATTRGVCRAALHEAE